MKLVDLDQLELMVRESIRREHAHTRGIRIWLVCLVVQGFVSLAYLGRVVELLEPAEGGRAMRNDYKTLSVTMRARLPQVVGEIVYGGGERVVLTQHGKPIAAIVTLTDLEDLEDIDAADLAVIESRKDEPRIPFDPKVR
jgi:antitoxin (DNA-binding transcriptional repressor) of toxin-antitoxin stability system